MHWRGFFYHFGWCTVVGCRFSIVSSQLLMNIGDMHIFGGLVQEFCLAYSQRISVHPDCVSSHRIGYLEKKWESVLAIFGVTDRNVCSSEIFPSNVYFIQLSFPTNKKTKYKKLATSRLWKIRSHQWQRKW